jgi:hypothetical protein
LEWQKFEKLMIADVGEQMKSEQPFDSYLKDIYEYKRNKNMFAKSPVYRRIYVVDF